MVNRLVLNLRTYEPSNSGASLSMDVPEPQLDSDVSILGGMVFATFHGPGHGRILGSMGAPLDYEQWDRELDEIDDSGDGGGGDGKDLFVEMGLMRSERRGTGGLRRTGSV